MRRYSKKNTVIIFKNISHFILIKPPRAPLGMVSFITREQITLLRVKPDESASCLSSINFLDNQSYLIPLSNLEIRSNTSCIFSKLWWEGGKGRGVVNTTNRTSIVTFALK